MTAAVDVRYFERFDGVSSSGATTIRVTDQVKAPPEDIRPKSEGDALRRLQQCLAYLGHLEPSLVDGKWDDATDAAIRSFQKSAKLGVDADYGSGTRRALRIALGEEVPAEPPKTSNPAPTTGTGTVKRDPLPPPAPPANGVSYTQLERSMAAWHSARLEIAMGVKAHGTGSWETGGKVKGTNKNSGPLVDQYIQSNGGSPGTDSPWCGHFHGWNYRQAGFDYTSATMPSGSLSTKRTTIFWSTYRLNDYFTRAKRKLITFPLMGNKPLTETAIKKWLTDNFHPWGPQKGDVVMCHSGGNFKHVAMVGDYDPSTFVLTTYEGNNGNKAGAWKWDLSKASVTGFYRVNAIGRMALEDFNVDPIVSPSASSPTPTAATGTKGTTL